MTESTATAWSDQDLEAPFPGSLPFFLGEDNNVNASSQPTRPSPATVSHPFPIQRQLVFNGLDQSVPTGTNVHRLQQYAGQIRPRLAPISLMNATPRVESFLGGQPLGIDIPTAATDDLLETWTNLSAPNSAAQSVFDFNQNPTFDPTQEQVVQPRLPLYGWIPEHLPPTAHLPTFDVNAVGLDDLNSTAPYQKPLMGSFGQVTAQSQVQQVHPPSASSNSTAKKSRGRATKSKKSTPSTSGPVRSAPYETPQWSRGRDYGFGNGDTPNRPIDVLPRPSSRLTDGFGGSINGQRSSDSSRSTLQNRANHVSEAYPSQSDMSRVIRDYIHPSPPSSGDSSGDSASNKSPEHRAEARSRTILTRAGYETLLKIVMEGRQDRVNDPDVAEFRPFVKQKLEVVITDSELVLLSNGRPIATVENFRDVLQYCHGIKGHAGRDKTHNEVSKYFAGIPKEVIAGYVKACPTCRAKTTLTASDHPEQRYKLYQLLADDPLQGGPKKTVDVNLAKAMAYQHPGYKPAQSKPSGKETKPKSTGVSRFTSAKKAARSERTVGTSSRPIQDPIGYQSFDNTGALGLHTGQPQLIDQQQPFQAPVPTEAQSQSFSGLEGSYDYPLALEMQRQESWQSWTTGYTDEDGAGSSQPTSQSSCMVSLRSLSLPEPEMELDNNWHRAWVAQNNGNTFESVPTTSQQPSLPAIDFSAVPSIDLQTSRTIAVPDTLENADWTSASRRNDCLMSASSTSSSPPEVKGKGKARALPADAFGPIETITSICTTSAPSEDSSSQEDPNAPLTHEEISAELSWLKEQDEQSGINDSAADITIDSLLKSLQANSNADIDCWAQMFDDQHGPSQ